MASLLIFGLIIIGTLIGALSTLIVKKGANRYSFFRLWKTPYLWGGFFLYGLSVIFYILALNRAELSVVYPLVSMNYLWTTVFSVKFLREKMNPWKWLGLAGIIIGIVFIGLGS